MRVRVFQMAVRPNKGENLRRALSLLDSSNADLNVFPEYLMGVGSEGVTAAHVRSLAEPLDGEFASSLIDKSGERGFAVAFSMFLLEGESVYNVAVLADRGRVAALYRKIHLFDAFGYRESSIFSPGSDPAVARISEFTAGLAVCFDLRFPELFRAMMLRGADLFIVPAAWYKGPHKVEQWRSLTAARAHENLAYLVAANQVGDKFTGHSVVVSPWGSVLAELGEGEAIAEVEVERSEVEQARNVVPVQQLLKLELYKRWLKVVE